MGRNFVPGSSQYGQFNRISLTSGQTLMAWVRVTSGDASQSYEGNAALNVLGDSTGSVSQGFGIRDGRIEYNYYAGSWGHVDGGTYFNDGAWHHIAASHGTDGEVRLYLDGVLDGTLSGATYAPIYQGIDLIGAGYGIGDYFDGDLAEVAAYSGALDPNEIKAAAKGISPLLIAPLSLFGYWPLHGIDAVEPSWHPASGVDGTRRDATLSGSPAKTNHAPLMPWWTRGTPPEAAAAVSSFTGTGALSTQVATTAGTGTRTLPAITGTGTPQTQITTTAGTGKVGVKGTGTPATQVVTVAGVGSNVSFKGTGATSTQVVTSTGTGAVTAPSFTAIGALATQITVAAGSGAAGAPAAAIGSGALAAQVTTSFGSGFVTVPSFFGGGTVLAQVTALAGSGKLGVQGSGAIAVQTVTVAGAGAVGVRGSGAVATPAVAVVGVGVTALTDFIGAGVLAAPAAVAAGVSVVTLPPETGPPVIVRVSSRICRFGHDSGRVRRFGGFAGRINRVSRFESAVETQHV